MKIRKAIHIIIIAVAVVAIGACKGSKKFEIEGQLLNMDQGTIYVYSSDGLIQNIDTIQIKGGRFEYSRAIERKGTFVLVFPNYSEVPIFAEPGENAELKGNAQQLNQLTVSGEKDNELMTTFRMQSFEKSPPQTMKIAEEVIKNNLESTTAIWLLEKYFIKCAKPDYAKALKYAKEIKAQQPDNGMLTDLIMKLEQLSKGKTSGKLPAFSVKDINGNTVSNETLKGKKTIIYTGASWDYERLMDHNIGHYLSDIEYNFNAVKISLDASAKQANNNYDVDETKLIVICQEKMFNSPIMKTLNLYGIGESIVVDANGNIISRNINPSELERFIK